MPALRNATGIEAHLAPDGNGSVSCPWFEGVASHFGSAKGTWRLTVSAFFVGIGSIQQSGRQRTKVRRRRQNEDCSVEESRSQTGLRMPPLASLATAGLLVGRLCVHFPRGSYDQPQR